MMLIYDCSTAAARERTRKKFFLHFFAPKKGSMILRGNLPLSFGRPLWGGAEQAEMEKAGPPTA